MLFQVPMIFPLKIGCYNALQKRIAVLQVVTSPLFCIYLPKKTVASLILICFIQEKAQ